MKKLLFITPLLFLLSCSESVTKEEQSNAQQNVEIQLIDEHWIKLCKAAEEGDKSKFSLAINSFKSVEMAIQETDSKAYLLSLKFKLDSLEGVLNNH